jgi:hypothetical protein
MMSLCTRFFRNTLLACLASLIAVASGCTASAQAVNLACGGIYHIYAPEEAVDATVAPTASSVDLTSKKITTPLGEYRVSRVEDEQIFFDRPASPNFNFVTHGTLDRSTGKMLIQWLRPEEDVKLGNGQMTHMARYAEFMCSIAKRLL